MSRRNSAFLRASVAAPKGGILLEAHRFQKACPSIAEVGRVIT